MAKIIQMALDGSKGATVYVEASESLTDQSYTNPVSVAGNKIYPANMSFEAALENVRPAVTALLEKFQGYGVKEVNLEFGLKLAGGVGFLFAKTDSEVTFKVSVKVTNDAQVSK